MTEASATDHVYRSLLLHAREADPIWLRDKLDVWPWYPGVWLAILVVPLFIALAIESIWHVQAQPFGVLAGIALVLAVWSWRNARRSRVLKERIPVDNAPSSAWSGWRIDVIGRKITRVENGRLLNSHLLDPQQGWSIGIYRSTQWTTHGQNGYWNIELRNQHRGPVATLARAPLALTTESERIDVDEMIDALVLRLGIRRSGAKLVSDESALRTKQIHH